MVGVLISILAGAAMSVQGVLNTGLGKSIGQLHANTIVQAIALICSLAALIFAKNGSFHALSGTPPLYLSGGVLAIIITLGVMLAMKSLGPAAAVSIILIAQLLSAALIEFFGLFGTEKAAFGLNKFIGLAAMIAGVIIFKHK